MRSRFFRIAFFFVCAAPVCTTAQQPSNFFQQNCSACHTIGGGRRVGPDLKDVTKRKDRAWLEEFMADPSAVLHKRDAYALRLQREANGIAMPAVPGLTPALAEALLNYIDAQGGAPQAQAAAPIVAERPFTPEDLALGAEFFEGTRPLHQGGPACISCHTLGTMTGLAGGRLGPDLTLVFQRLGGRQGAGAWLTAPPTPVMQSIFHQHALQPDEILALLSLFEDATQRSQPAAAGTEMQIFLGAGVLGTALGLILMGWIWRGRIRTVRRTVLTAAQRGAA